MNDTFVHVNNKNMYQLDNLHDKPEKCWHLRPDKCFVYNMIG